MAHASGSTSIDAAATKAFRESFRGEVILRGDTTYDEGRKVWNGSIDRRPALIAKCRDGQDVINSCRFAGQQGLLVAVRAGGHSFPGFSTCDDGMVIDLSSMKGIRVDPDSRKVRVQAGVLLGELDSATQPFGLSVPAGIVTHTGVAGLTLGGGIGWVQRKYGLTIDNLLSIDLVTATGEQVTANEQENADLYWGVRGGGGNFGIVKEFEFRLQPVVPQVVAGPVFWPIQEASKVLHFYREWIAEAPDELMTIVSTRKAPDLPSIPRELVGKHIIGVIACYVGSLEEGEKRLRPLKSFGKPAADLCGPQSFLSLQSLLDPSFPHGWWYYVKSCDVANLNDDVIDIVADYGSRISSPISTLALWQMGGAVARVSDDDTAFHGRHAGFTFNINGNSRSAEGFEAERQWARDFWSALKPYHTSVYTNFMMDEDPERIKQA